MTESRPWQETLVETKVAYRIEFRGRLFLIEHVPARINLETDVEAVEAGRCGPSWAQAPQRAECTERDPSVRFSGSTSDLLVEGVLVPHV